MNTNFKNFLRKYKDAVISLTFIALTLLVILVFRMVDKAKGNFPMDSVTDEALKIERWTFAKEDGVVAIELDTEYSTVHILTTEQGDSIEVFGQRGSNQDTITAVLENGVLRVTEGEVEGEEDKEDNSYIEILIPLDTQVKEIHIRSKAGLISYAVKTELEAFTYEILDGELLMEDIE